MDAFNTEFSCRKHKNLSRNRLPPGVVGKTYYSLYKNKIRRKTLSNIIMIFKVSSMQFSDLNFKKQLWNLPLDREFSESCVTVPTHKASSEYPLHLTVNFSRHYRRQQVKNVYLKTVQNKSELTSQYGYEQSIYYNFIFIWLSLIVSPITLF